MTVVLQTERGATNKQISFINKLVGEKVVPTAGKTRREAEILERLSDVLGGKFVSLQEASAVIKYLLSGATTVTRAKQSPTQAQPGYYVHKGSVFVVVLSKAGRPYAKRLEVTGGKGHWVYAPGAARILSEATPLSPAEATRLSHLHGVCVICAKHLKVRESVERGIGPVCYKRLTDAQR